MEGEAVEVAEVDGRQVREAAEDEVEVLVTQQRALRQVEAGEEQERGRKMTWRRPGRGGAAGSEG